MNIEKVDQKMEQEYSSQEEEKQNAQDKPNQKKKKNKKRLKDIDMEGDETDYEVNVEYQMQKSKIHEITELQEGWRHKYAYYESNPFALVVVGITGNVLIQELREYFNTLVIALNQNLFNPPPIQNVEISHTKQFAILQCSSQESKHILNGLNNLDYKNMRLSVFRTQVFLYETFQQKDLIDIEKAIGTSQEIIDYKIYLGGLPTYLKEEEVQKLCERFGPLKYFHLVQDSNNNNASKGYCFFEYSDSSITDMVIKALHGLAIADRKLKAQRASVGAQQTMVIQQQTFRPVPSNQSGSFLADCPLIKKQFVKDMLNIPPLSLVPSKVIQLLNMIYVEDLLEDEFYDDFLKDIREEAQQWGPVDKIDIPRPDKETGYCTPSVGKVFIKYKYLIPAKKARHNLAGRAYNKRTVIASFYPEDKFDLKEYLITD